MGQSRYRVGITLSEAHDNGSIITVSCHYCRTRRNYLPLDMREILGDVDPRHVVQGRACQGCGRGDCLVVKVWHPLRDERVGLVVRRLERVVTIRRAVWRDEALE